MSFLNLKIMEKEIKELIRKNENFLIRWTEQRKDLRSRIRFYSEHKFEEEVRIANLRLSAIDGIIYDFEEIIKDLKKITMPKP